MKTRAFLVILTLSHVAGAVDIMQSSFAGGELSPYVRTRVDTERYFQSAEILENTICIPQGPAIRRPGTRYVATAPGTGRLLPFPHATDDADILELTHELMRFYRDTGPILDVNEDPYSIATPFDANDLFAVQTWHSGDVMYLVDGVGPPRKLSRYGHTNWTIEDVPFTGGPYRTENTTDISISTNVEIVEDFEDAYIESDSSTDGVIRLAAWKAQTFTAHATYTATHLRLKMSRYWFPRTLTVSIRATSGGEPTGEDLASGTFNGFLLTKDPEGDWCTVALDSPLELTGESQYAIVIRLLNPVDVFGYLSKARWSYKDVGTYADGHALYSTDSGATWTELAASDFAFAIVGTENNPEAQTVTLTAGDDVFDANHVGALWQLRQLVPAQEYSDTLDANEPGRSLLIGQDAPWTLTTTGTWSGLVLIEASQNAGYSWETSATIQSNVTDYSEIQETVNALVRARMTEYESGSCTATLSTIKHYAPTEYRITDVNDPCTATATLLSSFGVPGATKRWSEGAWSTCRGWPSVVSSYADRLLFASTDDRPVTIWASKTGEYENFSSGSLMDDAFGYTLARTGQDRILWITTQQRKGLLMGTAADIIELQPTYGTSISPADPPTVTNTISLPCEPIRPVAAESALLVVQRHGRKLRELMYEYATDSLVSPDLTLYGAHATGGGITEMAWTIQPHPILWCARTDGVLAGLTYERNYQVAGWHRHTFSGAVRSVAAIPATDQDRLWLLVERTVDANTVRHVEYLADWEFDSLDDAYFVDSGLSGVGDPNTVFAGLDHLIGLTVTAVADGNAVGDFVVDANGAIDINEPSTLVHAGLPYASTLRSVRYDFNSQSGPTWSRRKAIPNVLVNFLDTVGAPSSVARGLWVGTDPNELMPAEIDGLFTGDCEIHLPATYGLAARVTIVQDAPMPMTVRAVVPQLEIRR